jgi:leukotriene-A4 hydrolase
MRMHPSSFVVFGLLAAALVGCGKAEPVAPVATVAKVAPAPAPLDPHRDYHSYADPADFVVKHLTLDLSADFTAQKLAGTVVLDLERKRDGADALTLDTRDLDIGAVDAAGASGEWGAAHFVLAERDPILGSKLTVHLPAGTTKVRIAYATRPEATGLQWVEPAQTAGGKHPFLYTQAQAIHARSFVPLQDTPQVRFTYDATIHTPTELTAVMAAEFDGKSRKDGSFEFRMPQPIPSYLLALAIGDLAFQPMSDRTGIWAEPSVLRKAAWEFADTEKMVQKAEALYGAYRWGRYDVLVLPPSFPWGGMENPRLTFATPSVIAGDRSLVSLVAHELAHSWSGNLVTNATWRDAWLNEGFTTYFEGRIMEAVYGAARADMERGISQDDLRASLAAATPADQELGRLTPDLRGRDPDDGFGSVPYDKGALFLRNIEQRLGRQRFDALLKGWFDGHAFTSQTTVEFLAYLDGALTADEKAKVTPAFLAAWIEGEGIPPDAVLVRSDALAKVDAAREAWQKDAALEPLAAAAKSWSVPEWTRFLDGLPRDLAGDRMAALDARFKLTASTNAEVKHAWLKLTIAARYAAADAALEQYLTGVGRRKLIVPLYKELVRTPEGLARAQAIYAKARPMYHSVARSTIEPLLTPAPSTP